MRHIIDDTNKRLLKSIQLDGRITNKNLAEKVSISPSPCLQRRKQLEAHGIIDGYVAKLDVSKITNHVNVIGEIQLKNNRTATNRDFEAYVNDMPTAVTSIAVSGTIDYFILFCAPSIEHYQEVTDLLIEETGIVQTLTSHIVMKSAKQFSGFPVDLLLQDDIKGR